jgi:hypothetical protein
MKYTHYAPKAPMFIVMEKERASDDKAAPSLSTIALPLSSCPPPSSSLLSYDTSRLIALLHTLDTSIAKGGKIVIGVLTTGTTYTES